MAAPDSRVYSLHYDAAGEVITTRVVISGFTWTGSTEASHQLTFKNGAGAIILGPYTAGIIGNVVDVRFHTPIEVVGLEVDVLGSGVVEVYLA